MSDMVRWKLYVIKTCKDFLCTLIQKSRFATPKWAAEVRYSAVMTKPLLKIPIEGL
ncbi:predicted protein [Plenodomus lingam JN3]|uniref:Predicted protein n=1 Tax=Leptosphaeria maculans (strain JN3 / isolate v23.1.3 / race Av1-4-5-6-7-8) TaxID=985895 RepID=E4ZY09_LEPMJ|nr:predicted protein [Plenodomus lingam JN3]CBX96254.1 predicted protein [Plenodomus lingam JN3]